MGEQIFGALTGEIVFLGLFGKYHEVPVSEGILEKRLQAHACDNGSGR